MRDRGFALLVAASVALPSSPIHPHLLIVIDPAAAVLYTLGVEIVQNKGKEGVLRPPSI